jgi:predicted nucleic acid-binding protein
MKFGMNGLDFVADTNILLYILEGQSGIESLLHYSFAVSVISEIELLGKHEITREETSIIEALLADCSIIELNTPIKNRAIQLRQKQKIKLPDALIAATAIELQIPLVTADKRLERIEGLNCLIFEL